MCPREGGTCTGVVEGGHLEIVKGAQSITLVLNMMNGTYER